MTRATARANERSGLDALASAVIDIVDELTAGDLLAAITPERLGERSGYAPSSVRYQLSRASRAAKLLGVGGATGAPTKRWAFDREHLLVIGLQALQERQAPVLAAAVDQYLAALDDLRRTGDPGRLGLAIKANLDMYTPGASAEPGGHSSERLITIAVAAAEGSTEVARQLRRVQDERLEAYLPVYERALQLTGRVLREGVAPRDLAQQVNLLLEGLTQRRRFEPAVDERHVLGSVIAIIFSMSRPIDEPGALDPLAAAIVAIKGRRD